jgi:hypothetical protein
MRPFSLSLSVLACLLALTTAAGFNAYSSKGARKDRFLIQNGQRDF